MKKVCILLFSIFLLSLVSATFGNLKVCEVYDDFISGTLDTSKWEIRQDIENQSFMNEYWVDPNLNNFHTLQNTTGDRRVYIVPKRNFTTGDIFEYDINVISKENNYMQMNLLTGDQYVRVGIMGYINGVQGYDKLGVSHIKIEFQENNFHLERTYSNKSEDGIKMDLHFYDANGNEITIPDWFMATDDNVTLIDNLLLTNANGTYELYVGSVSANNGTTTHIDYDNFKICNKVQIIEMEFKDLTNVSNLTNITDFYVKNNFAKIDWKESLDLSEEMNWFDYINISDNRVEINSSIANALNKSARITLNNVSWTTPRTLKNGISCGVSEGCTTISYNKTSGEFVFDVTGFSIYQTDEMPVSPPPSSSSSSSSGGGGSGSSGGGSSKKKIIVQNTSKSNETTILNNETTSSEGNDENIEITGATIGDGAKKGIFIAVGFVLIIGITFIIIKIKKT